MAELILTAQEQKQSFTKFSDETVGKMCKALACQINQQNLNAVAGSGAGIILVGIAHSLRESPLEVQLHGITDPDGKNIGDWIITVRQIIDVDGSVKLALVDGSKRKDN